MAAGARSHAVSAPRRPHAFHRVGLPLAVVVAVALVVWAMNAPMLAARQGHKVLGPVVVAHAVDVMDVLVIAQGASERLFEHEAMFRHVASHRPLRHRAWMVGSVQKHVAIPAPDAGERVVIGAARHRLRDGLPVARCVGQRVSGEVSTRAIRASRDRRGLATTALASPSRHQIARRFYARTSRASAQMVPHQEARRVVARVHVVRKRPTAATRAMRQPFGHI